MALKTFTYILYVLTVVAMYPSPQHGHRSIVIRINVSEYNRKWFQGDEYRLAVDENGTLHFEGQDSLKQVFIYCVALQAAT